MKLGVFTAFALGAVVLAQQNPPVITPVRPGSVTPIAPPKTPLPPEDDSARVTNENFVTRAESSSGGSGVFGGAIGVTLPGRTGVMTGGFCCARTTAPSANAVKTPSFMRKILHQHQRVDLVGGGIERRDDSRR